MNTPAKGIDSVLLVDDEEDIRDVLSLSLEDMGLRVICAQDGEEGLACYIEESPPVVLTDIKMPKMNGIELLQKIKRENPEAEVIMITGHGDMDLAIKSLKHDAADFVTKPINVDALEVAVKRACDRIVSRRQLREYMEGLEQLLREKTELQDHLSSLGLMIGSISHGIKGLLTGLDGGMYDIDRGLKKNDLEEVGEGWLTVKQIISRIRKMVLDILYYAKDRDLQWEWINVASFAEEVASVFESKIQQAGIDFVRDFDASAKEAYIDPGSVHSALVNLLENAVDACQRDTEKPQHAITFGVSQDARHVVFYVEDNGIGMDRDTQEKIFKLFYSSKGSSGTGLGLFISNTIVRQHGGEIQLASTPGAGTTFTIRIPASADA
jgi:signal transduction histidine kinase